MFPCEFCEISKNNFFTEHLQTTASVGGWTLSPIKLRREFIKLLSLKMSGILKWKATCADAFYTHWFKVFLFSGGIEKQPLGFPMFSGGIEKQHRLMLVKTG